MLFCNHSTSIIYNIFMRGAENIISPNTKSNDKQLPCMIYPFSNFKCVEEVLKIDTKKNKLFVSSAKNSCKVASYSASSGSITLECACVLPLFLFFCIQIVSILSLFTLHSNIEVAMHQEVSQAAVQVYALEVAENDIGLSSDTINNIITNLGIASRVKSRVGTDYLNRSLINGGSNGIHIAIVPSEESNQDTVDITLYYEVRPLIDLLGFSKFTMANRCRMKIWSGYNLADETSINKDEITEEMVYVAEMGVVYHPNAGCSYLNPSISTISKDTIGLKRNNYGEKYYPCEVCGGSITSQIYITQQGNRYHSSNQCRGLKRTISRIELSEALKRGLGPCSRCG